MVAGIKMQGEKRAFSANEALDVDELHIGKIL
jgi:hypothetical protein